MGVALYWLCIVCSRSYTEKISINDPVDSVYNRPTIYNLNQELNPTRNILLTLDSKRQLGILMFWILCHFHYCNIDFDTNQTP